MHFDHDVSVLVHRYRRFTQIRVSLVCEMAWVICGQFFRQVAPKAIIATVIGLYYLAFFAANTMVGWVGGFYETWPTTNFWLLHAAFAAGLGLCFLLSNSSSAIISKLKGGKNRAPVDPPPPDKVLSVYRYTC